MELHIINLFNCEHKIENACVAVLPYSTIVEQNLQMLADCKSTSFIKLVTRFRT